MSGAVWTEIKKIKNVEDARAVWAALTASYTQKVGERVAKHHDDMWFTGGYAATYKVEGMRWWKDRCLSVANNIVGKASTKSHFEAPTDETLAWGGFLGGTHLVWTDKDDEADAEELVVGIIRGAMEKP